MIGDVVLSKVANPFRIFGNDRYETNIRVFDAFKAQIDTRTVYLAAGENFPDALSGSVLASMNSSLVILVPPQSGGYTSRYISANKDKILNCGVFGGNGVVNESIISDMFNLN